MEVVGGQVWPEISFPKTTTNKKQTDRQTDTQPAAVPWVTLGAL